MAEYDNKAFNAMENATKSRSDDFLTERKIRRRESQYPRSEYGLLEPEERLVLKNFFGTEQFEGDPYDFFKPYGVEGGGYENWDKKTQEVYDLLDYLYSAGDVGKTGNPLIAYEKSIDKDIDLEKLPGDRKAMSKIPRYREDIMQPMEKKKGLLGLIQRSLKGGKSGYE